jgi:hypothetical protein
MEIHLKWEIDLWEASDKWGLSIWDSSSSVGSHTEQIIVMESRFCGQVQGKHFQGSSHLVLPIPCKCGPLSSPTSTITQGIPMPQQGCGRILWTWRWYLPCEEQVQTLLGGSKMSVDAQEEGWKGGPQTSGKIPGDLLSFSSMPALRFTTMLGSSRMGA